MRMTLAAAMAATMIAGAAVADDIDTVRAFYADILTDPAETTAERYFELFSPDVVSIPTPPGGEGAQGMLNTVAFLGQVVPDLTWVPQEIIETDDNRFVVRGRATGTPVGPFFGVDPATGKRFEIMSIDIVTVEGGVITHGIAQRDRVGKAVQTRAGILQELVKVLICNRKIAVHLGDQDLVDLAAPPHHRGPQQERDKHQHGQERDHQKPHPNRAEHRAPHRVLGVSVGSRHWVRGGHLILHLVQKRIIADRGRGSSFFGMTGATHTSRI